MKKVIVASNNPVKLQAVQQAFERMFPGEQFDINPLGVSVAGIPPQPMTDGETHYGARLRAEAARQSQPASDFWVGVEGGVQPMEGSLAVFAWVVVISSRRSGEARSGTFFVPPGVADLVRQGLELGDADDIFFGKRNSKQENGAIGLLTGDVLDRTELYTHAVLLALAPFKTPQYFPVSNNKEQP
jgi:inosine/xanthosine triphosphatase